MTSLLRLRAEQRLDRDGNRAGHAAGLTVVQQLEAVLLEDGRPLWPEQELDECKCTRGIRIVVEDRDRVARAVVLPERRRDEGDVGRLRLDGVEEAGVELPCLQPSDERFFGEDLRGIAWCDERLRQEVRHPQRLRGAV